MKKNVILGASFAAMIAVTGAFASHTEELRETDTPAKVTSGGSAIYGYLVYTENDDAKKGLYELTKSGAKLSWEAPLSKYEIQSGWLKDGKICGFGEDSYYGQIRALNYVEIDFNSGKLLSQVDIPVSDVHYDIATLNFADGWIYGYGKDASGKLSFLKSPSSDPMQIQVVKNVEEEEKCIAMTYCPADGLIYGINSNYDPKFVSISEEGVQSSIMVISTSSEISEYNTGLVYSPVEKLFYWNRYEGFDDFKSQLSTIDIASKKVNNIRTYTNVEQFSFFVTTDVYVVAGQPAMAEITSMQFNKGALSGGMVVKMPSLDVDGNALSGKLDYTIYLDDAVYKTASADPGSSEVVSFVNIAQGNHTFAVIVECDGLKSDKAFVNKYIGNDTPLAPAQVILSKEKVSWQPVTEGVNDGYIDNADMKYEVFVNGQSKGVTSETYMNGVIDDSQPLSFYQATVVAMCNNMTSDPGVSNKILAGTSLEMPVELVPTKEEFALMQTFDLDGDSYSWKCRDGYMESQWSLSKDGGNDWVVLAPVNFPDASKIYSLSYEAMRKMQETGRETLEVRIGSQADPSTMTEVLVPAYEPLTDYEKTGKEFKVPQAGSYYIAFHAASKKWEAGIENGLCVRNISLSVSALGTESPGPVTDLSAVRGAKGALEANLTFKLPVNTFDGEPLDSDVVVTATVTGDEIKSVSGAPGEEKTVTVRTKQGQNTVYVKTLCGEIEGTQTSVSVYTGVVVPGMVNNLNFAISDDMKSVTLTWDAPAEENDEGYVNPSGVKYHVYEAVQSFYDRYWELKGTTEAGATSFVWTQEDDAQKVHTLAVMSENVAGRNEDMPGGEVLLGKPYELPMLDDFDNGSDYFCYSPWVQYQPDDSFTGHWSIWMKENVINDGEGNVLVARPTEANSDACIGVPAFTSVGDGGCQLSFDVLLNVNTPEMEIRALGAGVNDEVLVGKLGAGEYDDMQRVSFMLPSSLENSEWVQLYFYTHFSKSTNLLIVDNVQIRKTDSSNVSQLIDTDNFDLYNINGILVRKNADKSVFEIVAPGLYIVKYNGASVKYLKK